MRIEEAKWLARRLAQIDSVSISPVLELGSSTLNFRMNKRPHIDQLLHRPLRERSVRIVHSDFKRDEGVEIVGDIFDSAVQAQIRRVAPRMILCCNMFEHVTDRSALARFCVEMLPAGGYMVFSGPYSYPYHPDPLDNMFRPTPAEVVALFPNFDIIAAEIVGSKSWCGELLERPAQIPRVAAESLFRLVRFWVGQERYLADNHRLLWLFRRFRITCVILRKKSA